MTIPREFDALLFLHTVSVVSSQPKNQVMSVRMFYTTDNLVYRVVENVR